MCVTHSSLRLDQMDCPFLAGLKNWLGNSGFEDVASKEQKRVATTAKRVKDAKEPKFSS